MRLSKAPNFVRLNIVIDMIRLFDRELKKYPTKKEPNYAYVPAPPFFFTSGPIEMFNCRWHSHENVTKWKQISLNLAGVDENERWTIV